MHTSQVGANIHTINLKKTAHLALCFTMNWERAGFHSCIADTSISLPSFYDFQWIYIMDLF